MNGSTLYLSCIDAVRGVYRVENGRGHKFTVEIAHARCGCATWKKTQRCAHLAACERYCRRHGLALAVLSVCPGCDLQPALMKLCPTCGGTGRIPEDLAKGMRLLRWPIRSEAENKKLLAQFGERTERDVPLTRRRFRAADDEAQAA